MASSSSERPAAKVIREGPSAYERWELPSMDGAAAEASARAGERPGAAPPTVAELDGLHRQVLEEGRAEGHAAGFAQGRQEGFAAGRAEVESVVAQLRARLNALSEPLAALDEEVEQSLVAIAVAIARQLVRRELKTDPGQVVAAAREALGALPAAARSVRLYLHPEDLPLVRDALSVDSADGPWRLLEDPLIGRGGCRVESETSRVDASVEARLNAAVAQVLGGEREQDAVPGGSRPGQGGER